MDKFLRGVTSTLALAGVLLVVGPLSVHAQDGLPLTQTLPQADPTACNSTVNVSGPITLPASLPLGACIIGMIRDAKSNFSSLVFTRISLQGKDLLSIYDGDYNVSSNLVINVTGSRDTLAVVFSAPTAYLVINTTVNTSSSALQPTFSNNSCNIQQAVSSPSILRSPVYLPGKTGFTCNYTVMAKQAGSGGDVLTMQELALSFLQVSLNNATLKVTTSSNQTSTVTSRNFPPDVNSTGSLQMLLAVPNVNQTQSFSAAVSPVISSTDCGQTKDVNGNLTLNITVPDSHPMPYDCRIMLKAVKGKSLSLNITSLQLAASGDSVVMVDGASLAGGKVLATFASTTSGYLVISGQNQVLVRLQVGEMVATRSLNVQVTELDSVGHLYSSDNFVMKPSTGSQVTSQYFVLEASAGSMVNFTLAGEEKNKTYSYNVSVYDGCQMSSPLLVTFSSSLRVPVVSSGSKMLVVARLSNTSQSVSASFSSVSIAGCDKVTSALEGSWHWMTTFIPSRCRWTVTSPPNSTGTIMLDLTTLKLAQKATVSVYSGVAESGSLVAQLNATNIMTGMPLPSVTVPASQWAQVVFSLGKSINLTSVAVGVRFQQVDTLCGGQIQASQGHLRSPAFPNLYPLNTVCKWTFPPSAPGRLLFFDFPNFQLAQNHSLTMVEKLNGSSRVVKSLKGNAVLSDVLYASNTTNTVTFSSQPVKGAVVSNQVAQGFDVQYWVLQCGGFTNKSSGSFSTPSFPATNATLCVWFVQLPPKTKNDVNIVNMTVQIKTSGSPSVKDMVKIYDGDTLRNSTIAYNVSGSDTKFKVLSRHNSVLIVVNASTATSASQSASAAAGLAMKVDYITYSCKTSQLCMNGICMHPDWRCNGKDDCGDNTDERNCIGPPSSPSTGTKPGIVVLLFFVGLCLGILLALIIPSIIRRFRTNRYTAFNNDPAVA